MRIRDKGKDGVRRIRQRQFRTEGGEKYQQILQKIADKLETQGNRNST
jgi:hypothetical protein